MTGTSGQDAADAPTRRTPVTPDSGTGPEPANHVEPPTSRRRLAPRSITLWRLEDLLATGGILAGLLVGGIVLWTQTDFPRWLVVLIWILAGTVSALVLSWAAPRRYANWWYRVDQRVLELHFGILWRTTVMIPLSRMQHIDTRVSPLQKQLDLATLTIHTAGTRHASHEIPHLQTVTASRLREELIDAAGIPVQ